jgi:hypothetical protein
MMATGKPLPAAGESAALRLAIEGWNPPASFTGVQLLPATAGLAASNPVLSAAFLDASKSNALVKSVQALGAAETARMASFPTLLGSSLSAQLARPSLGLEASQLGLATAGMGGQLAAIGERIAAMNAALLAPSQQIAKMVTSVQSAFADWAPHFQGFGDAMRELAEQQDTYDEDTSLFVARHGWPVPISLPMRAYRQVVSKARANKREVNRSMVYWFRPGSSGYRAARDVLERSPDFGSRRPLLRQVYAAQRRGQWYLVINGLLPLVEGVLIDAMFPSGTRPKTVKPGVERLVEGSEPFDDFIFDALETMILGASSGVALFDAYAPPQGVEPRSLNRHGVLHGSARRYGTEQNATKLFLLVTLLAECLEIHRDARGRERSERRRPAQRGEQ